jgi:hypothetical protein
MFQEAYALARAFTLPIIVSRQSLDGKCESGFASLTMVNSDGWFLTASHVFEGWQRLQAECAKTQAHLAQVNAIETDANLNAQQKKLAKRRLGHIDQRSPARCSALWGLPGINLVHAAGILSGGVDLSVGRLEPWDPAWANNYVIIKDPSRGYEAPGRSLCKLGFPFHKVEPTYDPNKDMFILPPEAYPVLREC